MESRLNINVSAIDYDKTSKALTQQLTFLEEMVHGQDDFVSVNRTLIQKLESMMAQDFQKLKGKTTDKKFLTWLTKNVEKTSPRFKVAIKEEMESSKFGIF